MLIETLGEDFDAAALPELDEAVRDQVLEGMPTEQVAEALQQLDSDDAVYVIEDLDKAEQTDILAKLPHFERLALERSLEYPEDSAGRIMQTDLIAVSNSRSAWRFGSLGISPIALDGIPAVAESFFISVSILRNDASDPFRIG